MNKTIVKNSNPYNPNSAHPHSYDLNLNPKLIPTKMEEFVNSVAPAGSIWSNSRDMLKYIQFELEKGKNTPGY